jgi:hypothetical protein
MKILFRLFILLAAIPAVKSQTTDSTTVKLKYKLCIKTADKLMKDGVCLKAKEMYKEAVATLSTTAYPKQQIELIDLAWKQISENGAVTETTKCCEVSLKNESYKKQIEKGDNCLSVKDYTCAKASYNEALKIKPGMGYPTDKITQINALEEKLKDTNYIKKAKKHYNMAIDTANKLYRKKDYEGAAKLYRVANSVSEKMLWKNDFLKDSIASCNDKAYYKKKDEELKQGLYEISLKIGNEEFGNKNYKAAIGAFQNALKIKPNEAYPKKRIQEAKKLMGKK